MASNQEINQALFNQILDMKGELKQIWILLRNLEEKIANIDHWQEVILNKD